jgi:hypothetical protein
VRQILGRPGEVWGAESAADQLVVIRIVPDHPPGDYSQDGTVDAADYVVWRSTLDQTGTGLAADGNGNNQVDAGDYDMWRANYGKTTAGSAANVYKVTGQSHSSNYSSGAGAGNASPIPEPASILLSMIAVAWASLFTRPRHSASVAI